MVSDKVWFRIFSRKEHKRKSSPLPKNPRQGKDKFLNGESSAAVMAAPFLSIRIGIGMPSHSEEEHRQWGHRAFATAKRTDPVGAKGDATKPFDGSTLTARETRYQRRG